MAQVSVEVNASPDAVWSVLADATAYGEWVVGAKQVTRAEAGWPAPGTELEYELGIGPVGLGDRTVVVESERPRLLVLRAEVGSLGAAMIRLELEPGDGTTRIVMDEAPVDGPIESIHTPLGDLALEQRNAIALNRLKRLAEERTAATDPH